MTANPGLEGITLARWVYQTLSTDAALAAAVGVTLAALPTQIGEGTAPSTSDPAKPWIVFTVTESLDVKTVGMIQVMAHARIQVRATVRGNSYGPLVAVYQRIHQLLEAKANQAPTGFTGMVLTCERVSSVQYPENDQGIQYRHLGGLYDTFVQ